MLFVIICPIYKNTTFKLGGFMCNSSILTIPTYQHKRFLKDNEKKWLPLCCQLILLCAYHCSLIRPEGCIGCEVWDIEWDITFSASPNSQ